jgi:hypothetical protein
MAYEDTEDYKNLTKAQERETKEAAEPKKMSFKEAFASARKGGDKTFTWNGKKYTTEMAGEKKAAPKAEPAKTEPAKPAAKVEKPGLFRRTMAALGGVKLPQSDYGVETEEKDERPTTRPKPVSTAAAIQAKNMGYKKGGSVSSASKRADGCATKGKTRGKMV